MEQLQQIETRVLACLLEKEITTPEYYPLSLNALVNACNQKSNRDPVMSLDEESVEQALEWLRSRGLAVRTTGAGSRVAKHSHRLGEKLNLGRRELAILCELMLRGPQTVGELRGRAERMHGFDDLPEVELVLQRLAEREDEPLVTKLSRRPGEKESRFAHLLGGEPSNSTAESDTPESHGRFDRTPAFEQELANLRAEVESLKQQFAEFRKQFE